MSLGWIILMTLAGSLIAFQSPINAYLGRIVSPLGATFVSFTIGLVVATAVCFAVVRPDFRALARAPWWAFLGGALGMMYVTAIIFAVPRIGVATMMTAALLGQMVTAMVIDHFGWFGLDARPIEPRRLMSLPLLVVAVYLSYAKK